ncbi:MAG: hypothetical protein NT045_03240 [Candidatus Aureabacteria bacterium]|nr:hypothetical protein [Candidatus Auribacterota bacterium]
MRSKLIYRNIVLAALIMAAAPLCISGCRSSGRVTEEKTVYKTPGAPGEPDKVIKETTIIKEKESHSVVGMMFIMLGDVVAFPFRMIAMMFDTII